MAGRKARDVDDDSARRYRVRNVIVAAAAGSAFLLGWLMNRSEDFLIVTA